VRAYKIIITNPATGEVIKPTSQTGITDNVSYTSFVNGVNIPGALNVEFDVPFSAFATPTGPGAYIKIWGVSLAEVFQAADLNGMSIEVYAGMIKGLPLAKPEQFGLIAQGTINQAFGNWLGIEMSIDFIVVADMGTADAPKNIILNWAQGQTLQSALTATFATAFPNAPVTFAISGNLVAPESIVGYYATVTELAKDVLAASLYIMNDPTYLGVQIFQKGGAFSIYDGTSAGTPKPLAFEDFIGQPTWIDQGTVQFKCNLRADLSVGDYVSFPTVVATQTASGASPFGSALKNKSSFEGTFQITDGHQFANFRQPPGESWNTTFNAIPASAAAIAANTPTAA